MADLYKTFYIFWHNLINEKKNTKRLKNLIENNIKKGNDNCTTKNP